MFPPKLNHQLLLVGGIVIATLVGKSRYEKRMVSEAIAIAKDILLEVEKEWPSRS